MHPSRRRKTKSKIDPNDEQTAHEKCLRLLALRARSAAELKERLHKAGYAPETIETVIESLVSTGLLDDEEFARSWVASRRVGHAIGPRRLYSELRRKGVGEAIIRKVLEEMVDEETEFEMALALAWRRLQGHELEIKTLARVRRLLLGRGFSLDTVNRAIQQVSRDVTNHR